MVVLGSVSVLGWAACGQREAASGQVGASSGKAGGGQRAGADRCQRYTPHTLRDTSTRTLASLAPSPDSRFPFPLR